MPALWCRHARRGAAVLIVLALLCLPASPAVFALLTLLLIVVTVLALLLPCAVLVDDAHHLFDEIPHRVSLLIRKIGDDIKTNQTTNYTSGLARLRQGVG